MRLGPTLALVVLAACSRGGGAESTDYIEDGIKPDYVAQSAEILGVELDFDPVIDCPDKAEQKTGSTFECFVYDAEDETKRPVSFIKVTFPSDDEYQWRTTEG